MGERVSYVLLRGWVMLHAHLPLAWLYRLSDLLYGLVYYVVRYRVKVTRRNLAASFPELTEAERRALERRFYHHFTDYIVETIKLAAIDQQDLLRRAVIRNPEVVDRLMEKGHPTIITTETGNGSPAPQTTLNRRAFTKFIARLAIRRSTSFSLTCVPVSAREAFRKMTWFER